MQAEYYYWDNSAQTIRLPWGNGGGGYYYSSTAYKESFADKLNIGTSFFLNSGAVNTAVSYSRSCGTAANTWCAGKVLLSARCIKK